MNWYYWSNRLPPFVQQKKGFGTGGLPCDCFVCTGFQTEDQLPGPTPDKTYPLKTQSPHFLKAQYNRLQFSSSCCCR